MAASDDLSRVCNLGDLRDVFRRRGFVAEGVQTPDAAAYLKNLPRGYVSIVRTARKIAQEDLNHFFLLAKASTGNDFVAIDPSGGVAVRQIPSASLKDALSTATGEMLVVGRPVLLEGEVPKLVEDRLNLGLLAVSNTPKPVTMFLSNRGNKEFSITEVKTSCGCLGTPVYKSVVGPGRTETIQIALDSRVLPPGEGERQILIKTNSERTPSVVAKIGFKMPGTEKTDVVRQLTVLPDKLALGKAERKGLLSQPLNVTLKLPDDLNAYDDPIRIFAECDDPQIQVKRRDTVPTGESKQSITYEIVFIEAPKQGPLKKEVSFKIWNRLKGSYETVAVHLTAEVY